MKLAKSVRNRDRIGQLVQPGQFVLTSDLCDWARVIEVPKTGVVRVRHYRWDGEKGVVFRKSSRSPQCLVVVPHLPAMPPLCDCGHRLVAYGSPIHWLCVWKDCGAMYDFELQTEALLRVPLATQYENTAPVFRTLRPLHVREGNWAGRWWDPAEALG